MHESKQLEWDYFCSIFSAVHLVDKPMGENSLEHVYEAGWSRFKGAERFIRRLVSARANFSTANNYFVIFR